MANIWEKAISILTWNLNSGRSYLITTVLHCFHLSYANMYHISSYKICGHFLKKYFIQRSQYIRPKVTVHKCAGIIRMWVLFEGRPYMRKYGSWTNHKTVLQSQLQNCVCHNWLNDQLNFKIVITLAFQQTGIQKTKYKGEVLGFSS